MNTSPIGGTSVSAASFNPVQVASNLKPGDPAPRSSTTPSGAIGAKPAANVTSDLEVLDKEFDGGFSAHVAGAENASPPENKPAATATARALNTLQREFADKLYPRAANRSLTIGFKPFQVTVGGVKYEVTVSRPTRDSFLSVTVRDTREPASAEPRQSIYFQRQNASSTGRANGIIVAQPVTEPNGAKATTGAERAEAWADTEKIFDAITARVQADPKSIYTLTPY
jgi:hypothetical protein